MMVLRRSRQRARRPGPSADGVRVTRASPMPPRRWGHCVGGRRTLSCGGRASEWANAFGSNSLQGVVFDDIDPLACGVSEDCLYLDAWTPIGTGRASRRRLPVMVWISMAGGFVVGSGSEPRYDGTRLAARGIWIALTAQHTPPQWPLGFIFCIHPRARLGRIRKHRAVRKPYAPQCF